MIVKPISASYSNKTQRVENVGEMQEHVTPIAVPWEAENLSDLCDVNYAGIPHLARNANFTVYPAFELEIAFKSLRKACSL
jgi:hypothetical protein